MFTISNIIMISTIIMIIITPLPRKSGSSPRGSVKSDSFDPSETESSTSERTSVEGERVEEERGREGEKGRPDGEEEERRRVEEERLHQPTKEQGLYSSATIKPKVS